MITVLCAMDNSNYYKIPGLDIYNKERNAYNYNGKNKLICHPPCQQWSKLKSFAHHNESERNLALFCWEKVNQNGGILEHPKGSSLFKYVNADFSKIYCVWQNWWGFKAKKETYLYCHNVELLPTPLNLDCIQGKIQNMSSKQRSLMTLEFCQYLVDSINNSI